VSGAIPPLPQYAFMVWCLVKHRDSFTFTVILGTINIICRLFGSYDGNFKSEVTATRMYYIVTE
jgi:hypothetical protein